MLSHAHSHIKSVLESRLKIALMAVHIAAIHYKIKKNVKYTWPMLSDVAMHMA